jgi:hypothetical protein
MGITETDYWQHHLKESEISSWRGIAFEEVCLQHIRQIKMALQIAGVSSKQSAMIIKGDGQTEGMQIDLLIDRADDVVNICEMKYSKSNYTVTKSYYGKLSNRVSELESLYPDKSFHLTYIGLSPLYHNEYADVFISRISSEELFK